jgi:hypothetical protein
LTSSGQLGHNEQPPAAVAKWINRINPTTKKQQQLIAFSWQKVKTAIIVDSLETYSHAWALKSVKKREALGKSDKRDHALSLFTLDRDGAFRPEGRVLFEMRTPPSGNPTQNQLNVAEAALRTSQQAAIGTLIADPHSAVKEANRSILTSYCELNHQGFNIFDECLRVFDSSRCHFLFDIVDPQVKRFLNAERATAESGASPVPLKWKNYRKLLLDRVEDDARAIDLLDFLLKARDDGLMISLWVAERRAERTLLETLWLEHVFHYVSSHEKQMLNVPAEKDRAAFNSSRLGTVWGS